MSITVTTSRRFGLLAVTGALLFAALPPAPAHADAQAVVLAGTAHLSGGFSNTSLASGCFSGTAAGTLNGDASATFSYLSGSVVTTAASGGLDLPGTTHDVQFTWTSVGASAVLTLRNSGHSGNAVLTVVPVGPPSLTSPCGPGPAAQVVGVGVLS